MAKPFLVVPWPPGRACSQYGKHWDVQYEWSHVTDRDGKNLAVQQLLGIIESLTEPTKTYILQEVYTLMKRAEAGRCVPTEWRQGERVQQGQVDRMGYGRADVLELKVFRKLPGVPQKCLRIYFVEPTTRYDLLAISARTKPANEYANETQNKQWKEAQTTVDRWWVAQTADWTTG